MENNTRKDFLKGVALGFALMFTIACCVLAVYCISFRVNNANINNQSESKNEQASTNTSDDKAKADDKSEIENPYKVFIGKDKKYDAFVAKLLENLEIVKFLIDETYYEEVSEEDQINGMLKGLVNSLGDRYSTYYTKEEYSNLLESSAGVYSGIGSTVSQNMQTRIMTIVRPFVGGPAYNAGLLPGDVLYKIDGEDITDQDLSLVVTKMKGVEGTKVVITILREGEKDPIDFEITRATIQTEQVTYEMLDGKIGLIQMFEFDEKTSEQFIAAVDKLESQGMKGLIVDVRDNPGGLLTSVIEICDRILPKGVIVSVEDKYGEKTEYKSTDEKKLEIPMVVITNGQSASASEIFTGAMQDYGVATIVGTNTFGKGIVQSIYPTYIDGTAVQLTTYYYFTPNGRKIHGIGIAPDIEVELDEEVAKKVIRTHDEDNQLQAAIDCIKGKLKKKKK